MQPRPGQRRQGSAPNGVDQVVVEPSTFGGPGVLGAPRPVAASTPRQPRGEG